MPANRIAAAAAALAAALAVSACGEKTLNTDDAEKQIADGVEEKQGYKPTKVECPDDMKAEKDERYECTITAPGGDEVKTTLVMLDDEGRFRYDVPPRP